jgi:CubicO group peptidase (beta-lactamase class C family)
MSSIAVLSDLQNYVERKVYQFGVPAVSIAVWHDNRLHCAAAGVLNVETGVAATIDSVFQIGSVTKMLTASLVMLLVDDGKIELDRPIKDYFPTFHVLERRSTQTITVRNLLSHTSGLISDSSITPGDPQDEVSGIARYVDRCFLLPQAHRQIGKKFSYSNAGYVIAGRVIELVSGQSWWEAVEERIFAPLGMTHSLVRAAEVLRYRAAMGHFVSGNRQERKVAVAPYCYLSAGMGPSGSTTTMSASDLVKFGAAHLNGGMTESGFRWMSSASIKAMQELQVAIPQNCGTFERGWGLGWMLWDCQGVRGLGHRGGTGGQEAHLQLVSQHNCVIAIQTNGIRPPGGAVVSSLLSDMLYEVAGVRPIETAPTQQPTDLARFTGTFGAGGWKIKITQERDRLIARLDADAYPTAQMFCLEATGEDRFAMYLMDDKEVVADQVAFLDPDCRGIPQYLFFSYRLQPRIA